MQYALQVMLMVHTLSWRFEYFLCQALDLCTTSTLLDVEKYTNMNTVVSDLLVVSSLIIDRVSFMCLD